MDATAVVAIYAAALSTAGAAAQTWRWLRARKASLRIELEPGETSPSLGFTATERDSFLVLWINVINDGEQPEQIAWLWVQRLDPEHGWVEDAGFGGEDVINPRGRKTYIAAEEPVAQQEEADFEISPPLSPYRVRVLSGGGENFFSEAQRFPAAYRSQEVADS